MQRQYDTGVRRGSVPVLSKTMESTCAMRSSTRAFPEKHWRRASIRCAVPSANGAASASAQGHATINTEVNAFSPRRIAAKHQNNAAPIAIAMTIYVKRRL